MSTESRLQCRGPTGKLQCSSGCWGWGLQHHWKRPRHVAFCGSVSKHDFLLTFFFFLLACMVSNSILIVYIAPAALHNKVTAISSPLPSYFLVPSIPIHSPLHRIVISVGLYLLPLFSLRALPLPPPPMLSRVLKGWMMAKSEPRLCSAAQKALYHPVPRSCWAAILYFMSRWSAPSINMAPS